ADFITMAKKNPGKFNLGTAAVGTGGYMCAELFKAEAGINVAIIPYKGTAPVMNDLLGGHVPIAFCVLPPALGNIQAGKLRAIAVNSKKRFSLLPDVPTFDESGMPGFEAVLRYGLLAPAGTSKEIVDRLSEELRKLVDTAEVQKQIHNEGGDPLTSTAAEYAADIDKEEKKWSGLVKKLGLNVAGSYDATDITFIPEQITRTEQGTKGRAFQRHTRTTWRLETPKHCSARRRPMPLMSTRTKRNGADW